MIDRQAGNMMNRRKMKEKKKRWVEKRKERKERKKGGGKGRKEGGRNLDVRISFIMSLLSQHLFLLSRSSLLKVSTVSGAI